MRKLAPKISEDKKKMIEVAVSQIEKQFGKGSIMQLGEKSAKVVTEVIPTGSLALDAALGIGGVPRGRVLEIFGPEASGKTTLCLHIIAQAQKKGGVAAFIDAEHALDVNFAKEIGVDMDHLWVSQPDTGEEALNIADTLVRSAAVDVVVVDSVASLIPRAELEGEIGDSHVGIQARLMSQALRSLAGSINKSRTCMIFTNQIRINIGVMFGSPETTSGGKALRFYASVRMDIRRIGSIKGADQGIIGNRTRVKVVKNKMAPPFREAEFDIMFNSVETGISKMGDMLDIAVDKEIVEKSGTWFSYNKERLAQGRENTKLFLKANSEISDQIEAKVKEALFPSKPKAETPASEVEVDKASTL